MDYRSRLNKLEERVKDRIHQIMGPKVPKHTNEILNNIRTSVQLEFDKAREVEEELKRKPATIAVTDITPTPSNINKIFNLTKGETSDHWILTAEERCAVPDYLRSILSDYDLACSGPPENEALTRTRIDAILLTTLAATKKRQSYTHHRDSTHSIASVRFQFQKPMKLPWTRDLGEGRTDQRVVVGKTDYSLWYGHPGDMETNLLGCEAKAPSKDSTAQALIYMAMLHHARKRAGREDTSVYGIGTDSYTWRFIYLDNNSVYSIATYEWSQDRIEIISTVAKIIKAAGHLAIAKSQHKHKSKSVEELSGLEW